MSMKSLATVAVLAALTMASTASFAAEPIVGKWKTESGETAAIGPCGASFCITLKSGQYAGKRIGRLKGAGAAYSGTITDPSDGKKYSGSAKVGGSSMKLRGCALKIFCKTQKWLKL